MAVNHGLTFVTCCCRFYEYAEGVPADSAAFMQQLEAFYARNEALLHLPQVTHATA